MPSKKCNVSSIEKKKKYFYFKNRAESGDAGPAAHPTFHMNTSRGVVRVWRKQPTIYSIANSPGTGLCVGLGNGENGCVCAGSGVG